MPSLLYAPFTKIEDTPDGLIIEGYATTERVDIEGQIVDYDATKACLPDYAEWGNIREMHQPIAAGKALLISPDDEQRTVFLRALIVDTEAQKKVRAEVYKGFSIGGKASARIVKLADGTSYTRRYPSLISEISLADRPANPETRFSIVKFAGGDMPDETETPTPAPALDAATIAAIKTLAGQTPLAKAASDPAKIVALIQQARNELELAGDMDGSAMLTQAISLVQQVIGGADPAPDAAPEETAEPGAEPVAEGAPPIAAAAKGGTLAKGTRIRTTKRLGGVEALAKSLLQLAADMGSTWASKIMQMASAEPADMAQAIGAEFTKAMIPVAGAVLNLNDRLSAIERQPMPGGPVIRQPITKIITGQAPPADTKLAISPLVRQQLDNLQRMARTAPNAHMAKLYDDQYTQLKAQYQD